VPSYFPKDGKKPGYGRLEINPPADRPLPPPAPTFYRSWSSQSGAGPVTEYPAYPMPPVVIDPTFVGRRHAPHLPRHTIGPPGPSAPAVPPTLPIGP
jgi:hypothetical protein